MPCNVEKREYHQKHDHDGAEGPKNPKTNTLAVL